MDEELKQQDSASETAPVETALETKRRIDRERKRIQRAEERARLSANQSLESKREIIEAQWKRNISKLKKS